MKKIYFYLILVYSINFYASDTITAVSITNINLREKTSSDSKILSKIKKDDSLRITSKFNDWSEVIFKDSIKGFVKTKFIKEVINDKIKIKQLKSMKMFFFKFLTCSILFLFVLVYFLKRKTERYKYSSNLALLFISINIASIITFSTLIYFYYSNLSFFQIIGVIIFMVGFFWCLLVESLSEDLSEQEFLTHKKTNARSIKNYISELNKSLNDLNKKYSQNKNEIFKILVDEFGENDSRNLTDNLIPIVGMPYELIIHYFGEPEKINQSKYNNDISQTFFYDKINNRGNDGTWKLKLQMLNNILVQYEIR